MFDFVGAPERIRTSGLCLRRANPPQAPLKNNGFSGRRPQNTRGTPRSFHGGFLGGIVLALFLTGPALADSCAGKAEFAQRLLEERGERLVASFPADGGHVEEYFASENGTWTKALASDRHRCPVETGANLPKICSMTEGREWYPTITCPWDLVVPVREGREVV